MSENLAEKDPPCDLTDVIRTPFMEVFIAEFIGAPARKWPVRGEKLSEITTQLKTFASVLTECATRLVPAASVSNAGLDTVLYARLVNFLDHFQNESSDTNKGWPLQPDGFRHLDTRMVRLWEVTVLMYELLGAVARRPRDPGDGGGGGELSKWPPHRDP